MAGNGLGAGAPLTEIERGLAPLRTLALPLLGVESLLQGRLSRLPILLPIDVGGLGLSDTQKLETALRFLRAQPPGTDVSFPPLIALIEQRLQGPAATGPIT